LTDRAAARRRTARLRLIWNLDLSPFFSDIQVRYHGAGPRPLAAPRVVACMSPSGAVACPKQLLASGK
jgi:hypothetical protein